MAHLEKQRESQSLVADQYALVQLRPTSLELSNRVAANEQFGTWTKLKLQCLKTQFANLQLSKVVSTKEQRTNAQSWNSFEAR